VPDDNRVAVQRSSGPIPAGLTTLRLWASEQGRTHHYVRQFWRRRPGFPDPVGELPPAGHHGGGRGEHLYDQAALNAWLAAQPDLAPPDRVDPRTLRIAGDERVTLGRFAALIGKDRKTVTQHRDRPGFPEPGIDGLYRAGDLLEYWNSRPGRRGAARRP
jgi:hypothetical protein